MSVDLLTDDLFQLTGKSWSTLV